MTTDRVSLVAAGGTHEGRVRDQNEDRWVVDAARGVFCVVDGVGGHAGGERASEIAADMLRTRLARETGTPAERLREAITLANNAIFDAASADPALTGMTCVLTAVLVAGGRLTAGHVGDTRLYKVRAGEIRKLTHDHSPVGEREDAGQLTEAEAMRHPRRNEVYRDVGGQVHAPDDEEFIEIVDESFESDAAIVICSDGLSDQVSSVSIRRIVEASAGQPGRAVEELIRAANDAGGKDNVTAVVVEGEAFAGRAGGRANGPGGRGESAFAQRRGRGAAWLAMTAGIVLGAAAVLGTWYARPDLLARPVVPVVAPPDAGARTWRVGLTPDDDVASITDALGRATAGDVITLAPGDYREAVVVRVPITIEGPDAAVLRPPLGAQPGWTALTISGAGAVHLEGFTVAGTDGEPLATGLRVERADVEASDLRVSGALGAALDIGDGGRVSLRGSALFDNPGAAVVAGPGTRLALRHCILLRNGATPGHARTAVELADGVETDFVGNAIADNAGAAVSGWPAARLSALLDHNFVRPLPRRPPVAPAPARPGPPR